MSSRRIRLKAVINLPQRRGKEPDSVSVDASTSDNVDAKRKAVDSVDEAPATDLVETNDMSTSPSGPRSIVRKRLKPTVNLPAAISRQPKHVRFSDPISEERAIITNENEENSEMEGIERLPEREDASPQLVSGEEFAIPTNKNIPPKCPKNSPSPAHVNLSSQKPAGKSLSRLSRPSPRLLVNPAMRNRPHLVNESAPEVTTSVDLPSPQAVDCVPPELPPAPPPQRDEPPDNDVAPSSKANEKRTTHRRLRKNGAGEMLTKARRDFHMKFGNKTPDKKQLTMFDLIFYNPSTNPMKPQEASTADKDRSVKKTDDISDRLAEERVDDVNAATSDDELNSAMPAPQVKVGPDGSLIIDEKSLVIETTGAQKRRYELANSAVVMDYGIGNSTTYSSFTNRVKCKEWTKQETLKFYRALNSVGTDFLLMQSIFPKRTRKDLKQKFKKEDRLNRDLVDKALKYPAEFDVAQLEKDLAQEEKENEEKRLRDLQLKMAKEGSKPKRPNKKRGPTPKVTRSFLEKSLDSTELGTALPRSSNSTTQGRKTRVRIKKAPSSSSSSSDEDCIYSDGELHYQPIVAVQKSEAIATKSQESAMETEEPQECVVEAEEPQERVVETEEPQERMVETEEPQESIVETGEPQEFVVETEECQEVVVQIEDPQECVVETEELWKTVEDTKGPQEHVEEIQKPRDKLIEGEKPKKCMGEPQPPVIRALSTADDVDFSSSDDEITFLKTTRQTRYGRIPQRRVLSSESESESEEEQATVDPLKLPGSPAAPDLSRVEPGSIVIFASPGQTSYQLFMVGPREEDTGKSKMTPIGVSLTPEVLATMTNNIQVLGEPLPVREPDPAAAAAEPTLKTS